MSVKQKVRSHRNQKSTKPKAHVARKMTRALEPKKTGLRVGITRALGALGGLFGLRQSTIPTTFERKGIS